jgi:uncharacterized lipoprotein YddW (UPF0748 family)
MIQVFRTDMAALSLSLVGVMTGWAMIALSPASVALARSTDAPTIPAAQAAALPTPRQGPLAAQALYRELENLTGRIESNYLFSRSRAQPTQLRTINATLAASTHPVATIPTPLPSELQSAQQLLRDWSALISQGELDTAQSRWQSVTQSLRNSPYAEYIAGVPMAQHSIRSIWLDRETIVSAGSKAGLSEVFERFKAAGINTVFVETVNAGYPIYPSTVAPEQNPLVKGWDPLQASVELGKDYGIKVHAWVWIFAAGNQAHNPLVGKPSNYPGPVLSAHPDWAGFDNHGNLVIPGQTKTFLDPANPEVRQYLFDLLSEIASGYDVDGIQFDYIRYPFQDLSANRLFGYGNAARRQFHQLTGNDPINLSAQNGGDQRQAYLWDQWTAFRIQQITSFVGEASRRLRRQKPNLTLSVAVFADDTYKRQQTLQQDWEDWADQGLVDWIVLMSYANNTQRFAELIRPWIVESSYRSTLVIPGIRLLNLPAAIASEQLQLLRDLSTSGYALFAADNLNSDVQQLLVHIQGESNQVASEADSLAIAAADYQALQREWNWLLENQQIQGDPQRLDQWVDEVNQIGVSLKALAVEPSDRGSLGVRSRLNTLERTLTSNLTVDAASVPYRLRTWQTRLSDIERLLAEGEAQSPSPQG